MIPPRMFFLILLLGASPAMGVVPATSATEPLLPRPAPDHPPTFPSRSARRVACRGLAVVGLLAGAGSCAGPAVLSRVAHINPDPNISAVQQPGAAEMFGSGLPMAVPTTVPRSSPPIGSPELVTSSGLPMGGLLRGTSGNFLKQFVGLEAPSSIFLAEKNIAEIEKNIASTVLAEQKTWAAEVEGAAAAATAASQWVDAEFGPEFRKSLQRFLLQSGDARTPRHVPTDLGPKIRRLLRDPASPGLLISGAVLDGGNTRNTGKYDVAPAQNDGSASLIGTTPNTYNSYFIGKNRVNPNNRPGVMLFGWIAAPPTFVAPCAYPKDAATVSRAIGGPWDRCGEMPGYVHDQCEDRGGANFCGSPWIPGPSQREKELEGLRKARQAEEADFVAFMLGQESGEGSWITPHLHAWAAEGREGGDERRDANGWLPFNEIALAHRPDALDLPQAVRPHAFVYSFDHWQMNFVQEAENLKSLFQRQRAEIKSLLAKDNVLPEAVFVGSDGEPDMLLLVVGLDSSLGVTKLSTAGAWVDKKVERWQQRMGVVDGTKRTLGQMLDEWRKDNDEWFCWFFCEERKLKLEEQLKKLFQEEAMEPLFV